MKLFPVLLTLILAVSSAFAAEPKGELIFPPQDKHCHGSTIVQCPNGDFLAAWFYGSGERSANDVVIQGARLKKGASEWSPVFPMADTHNLPDCNPVLFIDPQERLWLFWIAVNANRWENSILRYRISDSYQKKGAPEWKWQDIIPANPGPTFPDVTEKRYKELGVQEPMWAEYAPQYTKMLIEASKDPAKRAQGWMTRTNPIVLNSGRFILPLYHDGFNTSLVAYSDDQGATWSTSEPMIGLGPIQPTIGQRKDGTLVSYMRDSGSDPSRVLWSKSADNGQTWSVATDTDIFNPGSSLVVTALEDGRWAMIANDTELGRHRLSLLLSDDEGETWKWKRVIEETEAGQGGFAYPGMIQSRDGMLHMTYTHNLNEQKSIKHLAVHPDWITVQ